MDIRKLVGGNVTRLRREQDLKQERLAELSGLTQSMISQIENGHSNVELFTLNDLAQAFGVRPIEFFVEGSDDAEVSPTG
jgi:transcriptional regulator with XRE-family HTH domain